MDPRGGVLAVARRQAEVFEVLRVGDRYAAELGCRTEEQAEPLMHLAGVEEGAFPAGPVIQHQPAHVQCGDGAEGEGHGGQVQHLADPLQGQRGRGLCPVIAEYRERRG